VNPAVKLLDLVEAGADPGKVLEEASRAWLLHTAYQASDSQGETPAPAKFDFNVLGSQGNALFVLVNGKREAYAPQGDMTLTDLLRNVSQWSVFDNQRAYEWLQSAAKKVSEFPESVQSQLAGTLQETTTTAFVATIPSAMKVPGPGYTVIPPGVLNFSLTSADPEDGHIHEVVLDGKGDGITSMAGTKVAHAHIVDRYTVREYVSEIGGGFKFKSVHPDGINKEK